MKKYKEVVSPLTEEQQQNLRESGLSRLWQHNEAHDCAILTAFRRYDNGNCGYELDSAGQETDVKCDPNGPDPVLMPTEKKMRRNMALAADLKKMGYLLTKVKGKFEEGGKWVKEICWYIVDSEDKGNLEKDLIKVGRKYEQDSVLFIPKGASANKSKAYLIATNSCCNNFLKPIGKTLLFNMAKFGHVGYYTTTVNGRPFIFTEEYDKNADIIFGSFTSAVMSDSFSHEVERELKERNVEYYD